MRMCFFTSSAPMGEMTVHPQAHVAMFAILMRRRSQVYYPRATTSMLIESLRSGSLGSYAVSQERRNAAKGLELLSCVVRRADDHDLPASFVDRAHDSLAIHRPHRQIRDEERLDRPCLRGPLDLGPVRDHAALRDLAEQALHRHRLDADARLLEHLRARPSLERLLDPRVAAMTRPVHAHLGGDGPVLFAHERGEVLLLAPRSYDDQGVSDLGEAKLREHLREVLLLRAPAREHLPLAARLDHRYVAYAIPEDLREHRLLVVDHEARDERAVRRRDGLLDPAQGVRLPRLPDCEVVADREVQRVVLPQVHLAFLDRAREPQAIRKLVELDLLHADAQQEAALLHALGAELVGLLLLAAVRHRAHEVADGDEVVEVPQIVEGFHSEADFTRLQVLLQDAHARPSGVAYLGVPGLLENAVADEPPLATDPSRQCDALPRLRAHGDLERHLRTVAA